MAQPYTLLAPYWTRLRTSRAAAVAQRIAVVVVACSLAVMLIGLSTGRGLQAAISGKLTGLWGDLQIRTYVSSEDPNDAALHCDATLLKSLRAFPEVHSVRPTLSTTALIALEDQLEALVFRTQIDPDAAVEWISGTAPQRDEVGLPAPWARRWGLKPGDELTVLFSRGPERRPALRYLTVSGLFQPALDELDGRWMYGDLAQLQTWVGWTDNSYTALEIQLQPGANPRAAADRIRGILPPFWEAYPAEEDYASLYQWLNLFDTNLAVVVGVLLGVALFNSAVVVFILLLDQRKNIGILKTLGASPSLLTRLFIAKSRRILIGGLLAGNLLAGLFCFTQARWEWLQLDPQTYYVSAVPVAWPGMEWLIINGLMAILVWFSTALPAWYISKQNPVRSLQW